LPLQLVAVGREFERHTHDLQTKQAAG
jgi:hypothetical protein